MLVTYAVELALYLSPELTELSIMPVILGIMLAPKNRRSQSIIMNGQKLLNQGIGRAQHHAITPRETHSFNALELLYPPDL